MPNVEFGEEESFAAGIPKPRSVTLTDYVLKLGIVKRSRDAELLLGLLAVIFAATAYYFFTVAVPPEKKLGQDVLSSGETVPEYVKNQTQ